jgi:DNA polymerase-1
VRRAFVARDVGPDPYLLSADYSQIELRIMAHITDDPALVEAFRRDEDIHAATAAQVFGVPLAEVTRRWRRATGQLGVFYGSAPTVSVREDPAGGVRSSSDHLRSTPIKRYVEETVQRTRSHAETLFGRRYIPR